MGLSLLLMKLTRLRRNINLVIFQGEAIFKIALFFVDKYWMLRYVKFSILDVNIEAKTGCLKNDRKQLFIGGNFKWQHRNLKERLST